MAELVLAVIFLLIGASLIIFSSPMGRFIYNLNAQMWRESTNLQSKNAKPKWQWYFKIGSSLHIWIFRIVGIALIVSAAALFFDIF
ncbi:MAG: hypothetical protein TUN42_10085 [Dehalogenimonas sp.]